MTKISTKKGVAAMLTHALFRTQAHNILGTLMSLMLICLLSTNLYAQSPGLIFQPSSDVSGVRPLDPNRDGYASTLGGPFLTNDETESEVPFRKIPAKNEPSSDLATGPSCGFTDFVQNTNKYSAATAFDGTYIFFRFRLGGFSPASKGYSILIDTDQLFGAADPSPGDTHGFEIEVEYVTNFGIRVYNVENIPIGTNGTPITTYPEAQYSQKAIALTAECGNPDVFYDFFIPYQILIDNFGITTATPLRMVANTVQSTQSALQGPISDIGGTEKSGIAGWTEMIDLQPGTSVSGIQGGEISIATTAPVVTGPISDGATSVSGTSTEADGTVITVYKDGVSIGTTTVSGGTWTLGVPTPISPALVTGQNITATALATGKTQSAVSNTVTVSCAYGVAPPAGFAISVSSNKVVSVVNTANAFATGGNVDIWSSASGSAPTITNNPRPALTVVAGTGGPNTADEYCWKCDTGGSTGYGITGTGGNTCSPSGGNSCSGPSQGTIWATYTAPGGCTSYISNFQCIGSATNLGSSGAISINSIAAGSSSMSGTLTITNGGGTDGAGTYRVYLFSAATATTPEVFLASSTVNIATLGAATPWTVTGINSSSVIQGKTIVAYVSFVGAGKCFSAITANTAVAAPVASTPPVVTSPILTTATSISGTSVEAVGSTIIVYKNGVEIGTTTVGAGGAWTLNGVSGLLEGDKITATVQPSGKSVSGLSNEVTVTAPASTKTADVALIGATNYLEGGSTVQVDFPTPLAAGEIVKLYVDGVEIASYEATGGETTFDFTAALDANDQFDAFALYASGVLSATVTESGRSPSPIGATQTVQCAPPAIAQTLSADTPNVCDNSIATLSLDGSISGVIYGLYDTSDNQIAPSRLGTGSPITFTTIDLGTADYSTIRVKGLKISGGCFTDSDQSITVTTYPSPTDLPLTPTIASPGTIASGTAATVIINPTEGADVTYTLYNKADDSVISVATPGNSGSLSITTNVTFTSDVDIYVIARKTHTTPDPDLVCDLTLTTEARFEVKLPPAAKPDINNTLPGMAVTGSVLTNDTDPDGGTLSVNTTPTVAPTNGTLVLNADGTYTYQPNAGFVGEETFTYEVCSSTSGFCSTAVVVINVYDTSENTTSANNAPVVHNDVVETVTNVTVTGNALGNDFDPDAGQTLSVTPATSVAITGGTYSIDANGNYTFVPTTGFTGTTSFTYQVCDSGSPQACETATVNITVSEPEPLSANNAPLAQDDAIQAEAGVAYTATLANGLLINDFDPEGGALTVNTTPVTAPSHGAVTLNADGTYTYTPAAGYYGPDSFTYQVCDPGPLCDVATVYVMVKPSSPSPQPDINNTLMNTEVSGNVLTNDLDPQGLTLTVSTGTVDTGNGVIVFNPDGTYTYTPNFGFSGEDVITYETCNSAGVCQNSTLTIKVQQHLSDVGGAQNNPPLANSDVGQTIAGVTMSGNVIVNDFDRDLGQTLTVTAVTSTAITGGTYSIDANGIYTFIPTAGFIGSTSFDYTVCDNNSPQACETATVNLTVYPDHDALNNAPFAQDDAGFIFQNTVAVPTSLPGNVLANDFDPEGINPMPGTVSLVGDVSNGSLTLNADGSYTYTPAVGYTGPDQFTYQVCDAGTPALCDIATVYLTVQAAAPLPPIARNDIANTLKDTPVVGPILENDADAFGLKLTVNPVLAVPPSNGTVVFNADGTYTYTPNAGYVGPDSFVYQVCNSAGLCNVVPAAVSLNVVDPATTANTAPVVQNDAAETIEDIPVSGNVLSNDFDYNSGDTFTVTQINGSAFTSASAISLTNGDLVMNSDGTYTYTPDTGYEGLETFTYQTCDSGSPIECATATVSITVYPTGTPSVPFAQNDAYVTEVSTAISKNVFDNDSNLGAVTEVKLITPPTHGTLTGPDINGDYTYTPNTSYSGPDYFVYEVCNANGCSQATVSMLAFSAGGALPLDLLSFQAEKQGETVKITWKTINETEVSHFEIERSADGQTFTKIGEQDARNAGIELSEYVFIDAAPLTGGNYYRFKQVEQDGSSFFSQMVFVSFMQELVWSIYPNPTTDFVNIQLNVIQAEVQVILLDAKGQSLQNAKVSTDTEGKLRVNVSNLKAGAYHLQINVNGQKLNKMLVKY